jgi:hypothetical protein
MNDTFSRSVGGFMIIKQTGRNTPGLLCYAYIIWFVQVSLSIHQSLQLLAVSYTEILYYFALILLNVFICIYLMLNVYLEDYDQSLFQVSYWMHSQVKSHISVSINFP